MKHKITTFMLPVALVAMSSSCSLLNSAGSGACQCGYNGQCGLTATAATVVSGVQQPNAQTDSVSKALLEELLNADYSLKQYLPEEPKPMVWLDDPITVTADELTPALNVKSQGGATRYQPADARVATDNNDVFFHFSTRADGTPEPLHLRVQYYADDPLYYDRIIFTVDGFDYPFTPASPQRGKLKSGMYWENSDDALVEANKDLVYALANCKYWAQIKLAGRGGMNHLKNLTQDQVKDFYNVLTLYRIMGGTF